MHVHHAVVNSDSGPYVFIRLESSIDQSAHDVVRWAEHLSVTRFGGRPVVVHNHSQASDEVTTVWPESFRPVVVGLTGAGIELSCVEVDDLPPKNTKRSS